MILVLTIKRKDYLLIVLIVANINFKLYSFDTYFFIILFIKRI